MGIPGLTKFINNNSDLFLEPFELKNTVIVIDGFNLSSQLYASHLRNSSAFGGDYDVFSQVVKNFFTIFRQCNLTPIVIFDGGHETKKLSTIAKRRNDLMLMLVNFNKAYWTGAFFPLLLNTVFVDVLHELDITCVQCFFEADREIAAVARHLNCPVLSYDSDFFVFDVLYIPFCTVDLKVKESDDGNYITCHVFDVNRLFQKFDGLANDRLPLLPALLGNDYVENHIFRKFFRHIGLPSNPSTRYRDKLIWGILHWLKSETLDSAIKGILSHIEKKFVDLALNAINMCIDDYRGVKPVILPLLRLDGNDKIQNPLLYEDHSLIKKLPDRFIELYQSGRISPSIIDIINLHRYYVSIQVEDLSQESSQMISLPIMSAIHKILDGLTGVETCLLLYLKKLKYYTRMPLTHSVDDCFKGINIPNIMTESIDVKLNVTYRILSLTDSDRKVTEKFDNWIIFMISLLFWMKNKEISSAHFHSIILMVTANYIQTEVGYHRNYHQFMRNNAGKMNRLSKTEIPVADPTGLNFSGHLNSITEMEKLLFTQKFIKLRKHDPEITCKGYYISAIHLFASFQSVLKHLSQFNVILDYPLPSIKVQEFYCGTLLYNLYFFLNRKANSLRFIYDTLSDMPNVKNLYDFILREYSDYLPKEAKPEKARRLTVSSVKEKARDVR